MLKGQKVILAALVGLAALTAGCATRTTIDIPLNPRPGECRVQEVRPSVLSTVAYTVCWNSDGQIIGMVGGTGTAALAGAAGIAEPLALLGGAGIIGTTVGSSLSSLTSPGAGVGATLSAAAH